ncbi:MAG: hypothetical protein KC422_12050 [Trueperaceae bacterium]|nr:hypothetical protein [Trueperaceae bacterium]
MIEDSVESFILQYKPYAVTAEIVAGTEGNPLVECILGAKALHFLERTGPYVSSAGKKNIILNCSVAEVHPLDSAQKKFEVTGLSKLSVQGLIIENHGDNVVIDAGATFVLSQLEPAKLNVGDWIAFESLPPVHGFVLSEPVEKPRYVEEDSI